MLPIMLIAPGVAALVSASVLRVFDHNRSDAEMPDNVKTGLAYLCNKCLAAMITHANTPLFSVETVQALAATEGAVCVPSHNGGAGYPLVESKQETFRDGRSGGYSVVTEQGRELMRNYARFCADAKQCLHGLVEKYFPNNRR